jgi:hypothetical protein
MTDKDFKRLYKIYRKCLADDFDTCYNCPLNRIQIATSRVDGDLCSILASLEEIFGTLPIDKLDEI